eukprot:SAG11_NODE_83_length_17378_cov_5.388622_2_plen_171_part_00
MYTRKRGSRQLSGPRVHRRRPSRGLSGVHSSSASFEHVAHLVEKAAAVVVVIADVVAAHLHRGRDKPRLRRPYLGAGGAGGAGGGGLSGGQRRGGRRCPRPFGGRVAPGRVCSSDGFRVWRTSSSILTLVGISNFATCAAAATAKRSGLGRGLGRASGGRPCRAARRDWP